MSHKRNWVKKWVPIFDVQIQAYNNEQDKGLKKIFKGLLRKSINKFTDLPPKMVSQKLLTLCKEKGIDPFTLNWSQRKSLGMNERNKSIMMWEHSTPNSELLEELVKCKTEGEIEDSLLRYSGVCWVHRDEDNELNNLGYRSKRPGGWEKCYKEAKINVVPEK